MIKRISLTILSSLALLFGFIYLQTYLASRAIEKELTILAETHSLLTETRILISSIEDPNIHPNIKLRNVKSAATLIEEYSLPSSARPLLNPLNLASVKSANTRRIALHTSRKELPPLLQDTESLLDTLVILYSPFTNFFEYNPYDDFNNRSIEENRDQFEERITRAQTGIQDTISNINELDVPDELKQSLLTIITPVQDLINQLSQTTRDNNIKTSHRLRLEFLELIFPIQIQLNHLLTEASSHNLLLTRSRNTSLQIQSAIDSTLPAQ